MRLIGLAALLIGVTMFVLPNYLQQYVPFLRRVLQSDLRMWGGIIIGLGAIAISLRRRD